MKKSKASFTLIELLVVIAIIGILTGFVFVSLQSATDTAKDGRRKSEVSTIAKALIMNNTNSGNAAYPQETCNLGAPVGQTPCDATFTNYVSFALKAMPADPQPGQYYQYSSSDGVNFTVCATLSNGYAYCYESVSSGYVNYTPVPGVCGSDVNICSTGTLANASGSSPAWTWDCLGVHGGTTSNCGAREYATVGTYSWTVPAGKTTLTSLIIIGGGGGGGGENFGGGGGAGSGYQTIQSNVTVTTGGTISIIVGGGGAGGPGASNLSGDTGGTSSAIGAGISYTASGGEGGHNCGTCTSGAAGGNGFCSGGHGGYNGSPGSAGDPGGCAGAGGVGGTAPSYGGGGGGGAKGYGTAVTAGTGLDGNGSGHGHGGAGGAGYGAGGGGGGGAGSSDDPSVIGGVGAVGYVKFVY
jgi:prepilin-type N-terminal cleavage/methylation domain-containing protein